MYVKCISDFFFFFSFWYLFTSNITWYFILMETRIWYFPMPHPDLFYSHGDSNLILPYAPLRLLPLNHASMSDAFFWFGYCSKRFWSSWSRLTLHRYSGNNYQAYQNNWEASTKQFHEKLKVSSLPKRLFSK